MITREERRFANHWLEQKSGPRWKYYLQFTIAWTVVSFLVIFFLTKLFTQLWETGGSETIYWLLVVSFVIGLLSTHLTYVINEKRLKKILEKDQLGKERKAKDSTDLN
ncbi:MAG: hypothetical protein ABIO82_06070 [Ginsengibacter sp.]